ncbi:MAG TPA: hypothetical protein VF666_20800 [Pyrinomonadaceae bacterium]|jgi:hypothetical protein
MKASRDKNRTATAATKTGAQQLFALETWRGLDWSLVGMILAIKASLFLFAVHAYYVFADRAIPTFREWLEIWNRWDAPHYLDLARDGYVATGEQRLWIVFYPLYPWLARAFAFVVGDDHLIGAFIVSTLASVVAGLLLQRLARLDDSDAVARSAVVFLFIFPTSYFLHIGYTESLFVALAVGCFLAARTERWWLAGVLGALAGLTRINGSILIPALAVEALHQYRTTRRLNLQWLWIALAPLGFAAYLALNKYVTGDAFAFTEIASQHWFKTLSSPWHGITEVYNSVWWRTPSDSQMVGMQELFFILLGLMCTVWCWRALRPSYAVWMTLNWLLWTSTSFVLSAPRYTVILFPIYILFARLAAARPLWGVVITVWSLLLLSLFVSRFVQGLWAF